jgi:hypothetical protein
MERENGKGNGLGYGQGHRLTEGMYTGNFKFKKKCANHSKRTQNQFYSVL